MDSRDDQRTPDEPDAQRQEDAAAELSDRSAESVGRRYDATSESLDEEETGHDDLEKD